MLSQLSNVAQDTSIPAWVAWLAVVLNIMAIIGGLYGLGRWLRSWILKTVAEPISQVANIAEHADKQSQQNAKRIADLDTEARDHFRDEATARRQLSKRIDILYARTGG